MAVLASKSHEVRRRILWEEDLFIAMLYLERRRAERAQKGYVLILVELKDFVSSNRRDAQLLEEIGNSLCDVMRETDIVGWYAQESVIGIICTEIGRASPQNVEETISNKFRQRFFEILTPESAARVFISFHFFPESRESNSDNSANAKLYPDLWRKAPSRRLAMCVKRTIDIVGSACTLILLSPLFALIGFAIKATSKGPVLFRQERFGQYGRRFKLLKFRSMRTNCDNKIHEEYVSRFIAGQLSSTASNGDKQVFKLQNDPRITRVGAFLRKTSLDELPQFWNVLTGEMSLVGPRPPVEYEFKEYDLWHRRRVLEVKPGITGLWQVEGRSRTDFDDMVRLDLKYACSWTIWLDLKLLFRTPKAVISGDGAH